MDRLPRSAGGRFACVVCLVISFNRQSNNPCRFFVSARRRDGGWATAYQGDLGRMTLGDTGTRGQGSNRKQKKLQGGPRGLTSQSSVAADCGTTHSEQLHQPTSHSCSMHQPLQASANRGTATAAGAICRAKPQRGLTINWALLFREVTCVHHVII